MQGRLTQGGPTQVLLLRFDAPLMSFGGVVVDGHNGTDAYPYRGMLVGLVANALGLERTDAAAHEALQARLHYAARIDRPGTLLVDFQTVDFSARGTMSDTTAWTTRGALEPRKGGGAGDGTHIRERHYWAGAVLTVALALTSPEVSPTPGELGAALRVPARPLFLGRKCCIPSVPIWLGEIEAPSLRHALESTPRLAVRPAGSASETPRGLPAVWPRDEGFDESRERLLLRAEDRDWENAIHVGRRALVEGLVHPPMPASHAPGEVAS